MIHYITRNICIFLVSLLFVPSAFGQEKMFLPEDSPLSVSLSAVKGVDYTTKKIPLKITIENTSSENVTLLRLFQPAMIFFYFSGWDPKSKLVSTPVTTAQPRATNLEYLTLKPSESFGFVYDLAELVKDGKFPSEKLVQGQYTFFATYMNKFGENCFKGFSKQSDPIKVFLK